MFYIEVEMLLICIVHGLKISNQAIYESEKENKVQHSPF